MSDVPIKMWWENRKIKLFLYRWLSFVNRNWESFVDSNLISFWLVFCQGVILGVFLQTIIAKNLHDAFFNFRLSFLLVVSIICFFLMWIGYSFILSKFSLGRLSRGGIYEILKYDAFTYIPFTISIIVGTALFYTDVLTDLYLWLFVTGLIPMIFLKILIYIFHRPDKNVVLAEKTYQIKANHVNKINDLNADIPHVKMFELKDPLKIRKHAINDELRNAVNLKNVKNGKLRIKREISFDLVNYAVGWQTNEKYPEGNLKLYLRDGKSEKIIFNKDAENIINGWNQFQIPLSTNQKNVEIRWENSIKDDIYLSLSNLSSTKSKAQQKKKNIIVIVLDGIIPETVGLYRGEKDSDNISRFFKDSSVMFTNAYVQGEWTMPNFASISSSLYQSHHGIYDPDLYSSELPYEYKTLAEILQENGFKTLGYVGHNRVSPGYGHARGYDRFFYRLTRQRVGYDHKDIIFNALHFLKENQQTNNFLFLHFFDTHTPHFQTPSNISSEHDALFNKHVYTAQVEKELEEDGFAYMRELYTQKYKEVDDDLSILFDHITKYENDCTTVILAADHGVLYYDKTMKNVLAGGEKGGREDYLVDSLMKVPFLVRFPEGEKRASGKIEDIIEANIAIMPTVLKIAGLKPPKNIDGVSVLNKNNDTKGIVKDYAIAESNFKNRYELYLKTKEFKYFLKVNRNRDTGEILKTVKQEKIFDSKGSTMKDKKIIDKIKSKVRKILKENNLPDVVDE